jgi:hypothetical protein
MYVCLFVSASLAGRRDVPAAELDSILAQARIFLFPNSSSQDLGIYSHALRIPQAIFQGTEFVLRMYAAHLSRI